MFKEKVLVTGANGQIGTVLTDALSAIHGRDAVLATDIRVPEGGHAGPFELLDALDRELLRALVREYGITQIYHLAAILSARGEQMPQQAWEINMDSLFNVLETAREFNLRVFFPSSIAAFGANSPKEDTPQHTIMEPSTVYGISKVAGELWSQYYHAKYGVDVRSVRYPGIIGYQSLPGGGTTDFAVEIYHRAVKGEPFVCFIAEGTRLPMMYMDDAIRATIELMQAPRESISVRTSYNIAGMSFAPEEVAAEIRKHFPAFEVSYQPDFRQEIAATWTASIDDSAARTDWGWKPAYDLANMTEDMIRNLKIRYGRE